MEIKDYGEKLRSRELKVALKIHSDSRKFFSDFLRAKGFIEIPPVIISSVTDPLNHPTEKALISAGGFSYELTKSMIFHKQMVLNTYDKIFAFSPNIRLEETQKKLTGRHLLEFTQLDLEVKNATREDILRLGEEMFIYAVKNIKEVDGDLLDSVGRVLKEPQAPFERITYEEAYEKYGDEFENKLSSEKSFPFWIIDIPVGQREFYDREDRDRPGILVDYDLVYPEGFGEALSGGEREHEIERIIERIERKGQKTEQFTYYIEFVRNFGLPPSAGFGIGIERFVRFVIGAKRIEDIVPFPKAPGEFYPI